MAENIDKAITTMTRLTQLLADFKAVRTEMGEVLTQLVAWDEEEFIEVSTLGWPHDPSLKTWIKEWMNHAVLQDGVTPSELSRTFAFGTGPVLVRAQHVLDHYWLVTTHTAVYRQDGSAGADEGNETAVAVVRIRPVEDVLNRSGGKPAGGLQFQYGRDEYGPVEWVGMPPDLHRVLDILDMTVDCDAQRRVAAILRRMGAPRPAADHLYGWEDVFIEEPGWLWIMYRRNRPRRR